MSLPSSAKCVRCKKQLMKKVRMQCSACDGAYDLNCINMSFQRYQSFYAQDKNRRDSWKCPDCVNQLPNTESKTTGDVSEVSDYVTKRVKPTSKTVGDMSGDIANEGDDSFVLPENSAIDFKRFWEEMRAARVEMAHFRTSVTSLMEIINSQNDRIESQNERIQSLESRLEVLESNDKEAPNCDIAKLQATISNLKAEIEDRNQDMLENDVEIACLPEASNENATHVVLTVAKKLGVALDERDVVTAQRVGTPRTLGADGHDGGGGGAGARPRPLVVRLTRRSQRDALLQAARVRRRLSTEGMDLPNNTVRPFYINERLTRLNRQLHQRVREVAKKLGWKYVWTRDGKIFTRQDNGKPRHRVQSTDDIPKVFGNNAVGM